MKIDLNEIRVYMGKNPDTNEMEFKTLKEITDFANKLKNAFDSGQHVSKEDKYTLALYSGRCESQCLERLYSYIKSPEEKERFKAISEVISQIAQTNMSLSHPSWNNEVEKQKP